MRSTAGPRPAPTGSHEQVGLALRRNVIGVGLTVASVALLTWAKTQFDGLVMFQYEQLLLYLLVCVAASTLGGRVVGVAALVCSGLAVYVYGLEPVGTLRVTNPGDLAEAAVFIGVTALVTYLAEAKSSALTRAATAEFATATARRDMAAAKERERDIADLRRSEERLRSAFEALMDPVGILEAVRGPDGSIVDYRYLHASQVLIEAAQDRTDHLIGARVSEVFPDMAAESKQMWDHIVETGQPLVRNGLPLYSALHHSMRRFDVRGGRIGDGLVFTYRDVTTDVEAAARLRRSERLYRILSENTNDAVFIIRGDFVTWASPSTEPVLGWHPDEMVGKLWSDFIAPQDLDSLTTLEPQVTAGERVRSRARYVARDGVLHWAMLDFATLLDDDGEYEGILVSGRRIDAEVAAEAALREVNRQRDRLIEQLPVGVFRARLSPANVVTLDFLSARASELLRQAPGEQINVAEVLRQIHARDLAELRASGRRTTDEQRPLVWEGRLRDTEPPVWLRIQANVEAAGQELVLDGLIADITPSKEYEAALAREADSAARRADLLAEIDRTKSALLAALGHDLRTPLAVISSAAASLRHSKALPSAQRAELLTNIECSSESLAHLLTNLLDLSRVEANSLPVQLGPVDVIEALEEPLLHAGDGIRLELPEDLSCVVADPGLLERVLDNLLRNAQRHRPPGTAVTVAAARVGERVQLRVVDHGPGVPEERYDDIFVPFQRLGDRIDEGIGLGLSIARAFTRAMGGTLTPSATPGGGLTMTIDLEGCNATRDDR